MRFLVSSILFVLLSLIEMINSPSFAITNKDLTLTIQTLDAKVFNLLMSTFSHVIVLIPGLAIFIAHFSHPNKIDSFYNLFILTIALAANVVSKALIKEYRPFLLFEDIKALNCECSFGMPSGHSATITISVLVLWDCLLQFRESKGKFA